MIPGPLVPTFKRGRLLTESPVIGGYKRVSLSLNARRKHHYVHRLVATAFIGEGPEGMEVCHADGNPANNHVGNLRWDTKKANGADTTRHGRHPQRSRTHCVNGHEFSPENTFQAPSKPGVRLCRACARERDANWKKRQKGQTPCSE